MLRDARHHPTSCSPTGSGRKRGAHNQAPGRSQGGLTTKVNLIVDGRGRPLKVIITPGEHGDITTAPALFGDISARQHVLTDKAYACNALRALNKAKRAKAVIPSTQGRKRLIRHDKASYKMRNQIERCINRLKYCHRFATCDDCRATRFLAFIHLACAMQWRT